MNGLKNTRILLSPLDWGLGHATRCIPLIRFLQELGCEVVLATSGAPEKLLLQEFPNIEVKQLKGYHIRYGKGASLFLNIAQQLPSIFNSIRYEQQWLQKLLQQEQFDLIISDNRPGFYSKAVPSVYITHQLLIHSGKGKWMNRILQRLHTVYMKKFTAVWVPDTAAATNLAGELAHPAKPLVQPVYMGLLSRMQRVEVKEEIDLLIMLSGPEPQRTILETQLLQSLHSFQGKTVLVRGLPNETTSFNVPAHVTVHAHLSAQQLQETICAAKSVVCRSGYTSLMDLVHLQKKAVLIPTPGQPEQEYLAQHMQLLQLFPYLQQKEVTLQRVLQTAAAFNYQHPFATTSFEEFKPVLIRQLDLLLAKQ
ncbi:putative glycosyltransferase [Lacibacter cauensis]|uniref:Putative glycosyltransferase n=1 Tax=Lacibacter cauensis TaxID=510947 RepID=A0A562SPW2_9BACT|nr:glycosyltransferase [Lacibacter cauensis]TWI83238.1 putative glycosyltransferase [Lacibacter cauensis]